MVEDLYTTVEFNSEILKDETRIIIYLINRFSEHLTFYMSINLKKD